MAHIYETIIIGATPEGLALAEMLSGEGRKIILISSNFTHKTSKYKLENVELLQAEAVFLNYSHGLFGVNTMVGSLKGVIYGTRLVVATGTKPIKSTLKNTNICYKATDILGKHKSEPAVVYGNNEQAINYALDLAKRFCYVYLCTRELDLKCSKRLQKKINETANIVHLPGCNVIGCKNGKDSKLIEVALDTYASIKATAIVFSLGRVPDFPAFIRRYIGQTSQGFADIKEFNESKLVPDVYVIGELCATSAKKDITKLAEHLRSKTN